MTTKNNVIEFKNSIPKMIDMDSACEILGLNYDSLYNRAIKQRKIEYFQDGRGATIQFELSTILQYKESMRMKAIN